MGLSRSSLTKSGAVGGEPVSIKDFNAKVEAKKTALDEDSDSEFSDQDNDGDDNAADEGNEDVRRKGANTEKEQSPQDAERHPNTSAKRIRALTSIIRILLESRHIRRVVTTADITNASYTGTQFTDEETQVAATILNCLRPYRPSRARRQQATSASYLATSADRFYRKSSFWGHEARAIRSLATARRSLSLTAAGFHQIASKEFDTPVTDSTYITSAEEATRKKLDVFAAFFDADSFTAAMGKHGLDFAWRTTYRWVQHFLPWQDQADKKFYHICLRRRTTKRKDGESDGRV
jgi:hypothetical protein